MTDPPMPANQLSISRCVNCSIASWPCLSRNDCSTRRIWKNVPRSFPSCRACQMSEHSSVSSCRFRPLFGVDKSLRANAHKIRVSLGTNREILPNPARPGNARWHSNFPRRIGFTADLADFHFVWVIMRRVELICNTRHRLRILVQCRLKALLGFIECYHWSLHPKYLR